jgi:sugar phosphate isomerase/epimerase
MKQLNRREALLTLSAAGSALLLGSGAVPAEEPQVRRTKMGIVTYAFGIHQKNHWAGRHEGLSPALALLEESNTLGAAGIQVDLGPQDAPHAKELRARSESYGMYIEASVTLPKSEQDLERFDQTLSVAQAAGARFARTTIMPGRRYEEFKSLDEFHEAEQRGMQSLRWAKPVLARRRFHLAIENHKDQRIGEKLSMLEDLGSEWIGLCVDVGNSFTLVEDPLEVARAFAPHALTVHFKDQAVEPNPDGFWFADVPLGQGFLDLPELVRILRTAKPDIHLNLELITRDPLNVPVLENDFWLSMPYVPARELARTMRVVGARGAQKPFVRPSTLSVEQQLALEAGNVRQSLAYARDQLGLV